MRPVKFIVKSKYDRTMVSPNQKENKIKKNNKKEEGYQYKKKAFNSTNIGGLCLFDQHVIDENFDHFTWD